MFGCMQFNKLIDGSTITERDGHIRMEVKNAVFGFTLQRCMIVTILIRKCA